MACNEKEWAKSIGRHSSLTQVQLTARIRKHWKNVLGLLVTVILASYQSVPMQVHFVFPFSLDLLEHPGHVRVVKLLLESVWRVKHGGSGRGCSTPTVLPKQDMLGQRISPVNQDNHTWNHPNCAVCMQCSCWSIQKCHMLLRAHHRCCYFLFTFPSRVVTRATIFFSPALIVLLFLFVTVCRMHPLIGGSISFWLTHKFRIHLYRRLSHLWFRGEGSMKVAK